MDVNVYLHKNKVVFHYIEENTEISTVDIYVVL